MFPRPGEPDSQFAIAKTMDEGGDSPIITALSVTTSGGLNGTNITCEDANALPGEADVQQIIVTVFGK